MSKEQLENLIIKTDKRNQKNKRNRTIIVYLFFAALWAWFAFPNTGLIGAIFTGLLASIGHLLLNFVIFHHLIETANNEDANLKALIKRYEDEYGESIML